MKEEKKKNLKSPSQLNIMRLRICWLQSFYNIIRQLNWALIAERLLTWRENISAAVVVCVLK